MLAPGRTTVDGCRLAYVDLTVCGVATIRVLPVEVSYSQVRFTARRSAVNGNTGSKVFDVATNVIKRDTLQRSPGYSIGGGCQNNVVNGVAGFIGQTICFKVTTSPDKVDFTGGINLRR